MYEHFLSGEWKLLREAWLEIVAKSKKAPLKRVGLLTEPFFLVFVGEIGGRIIDHVFSKNLIR